MLAISATTLLGACAETSPVSPDQAIALPASINAFKAPQLPESCKTLEAPENTKLAFHTYAVGVQIYRWSGTAWSFVAPEATLYANAGATAVVGTHYEGPKWESNSGSIVKAGVKDRCTPNPNAIQWLSLNATGEGSGIFSNVVFIQRVNTAGGKEPATPGASVGAEARVPYTAEYYFYRAK